MSTVNSNALLETVESLRQSAAAALGANCADALERFERQLNEFDAMCREAQQALWANEAQAAIAHLENGEPLTATDQAVIRAFLISDAERYVALENNYNDWVTELDRLLREMAAKSAKVDRTSIADLRGVVKDAVRLVPDIRNYQDERNRIERCVNALETLDADSRAILAGILREDMASPNR